MSYTPNPYEITQPTSDKFVETAAAEFRALKALVQALVVTSNYAGSWASLTGGLAAGKSVTHAGSVWFLLTTLVDVTASEPGVTADWLDIGNMRRSGDVMTGPLTVPELNGGQLAGFRNKLINPFTQNQRAHTTAADDTYVHDRWYVLTESGSVTVGTTVDPEPGSLAAIKLTQPDATAKRMGIAQIIESGNIRQHMSRAMCLSARVKTSGTGGIRYAILEHTGTANVVTSDVVNDWSSSNFTAGNFFIAGLTVLKTGVVAPGAAIWGDIEDAVVHNADIKNVIIMFWLESAIAQNGTLEIAKPQYEPGIVATPHEWRMNELQLCQRYYETADAEWRFDGVLGTASASTGATWTWKVQKRANPVVAVVAESGSEASPIFTVTAKSTSGAYAVWAWTNGNTVIQRSKAAVISGDCEL